MDTLRQDFFEAITSQQGFRTTPPENKRVSRLSSGTINLRKIVEKEIEGSNATVPGDDKIGSRVSWWFAGSARYPSNPSGIT
jgi:hypothetical protein